MSSYTLNIKVTGGEISSDTSVLTADSVEYVVAAFTFDESWNDLIKTAIFRVGELVYHSPLENDTCVIPFEALREPIMFLSVFGIINDVRATTTELPIQIQNSGYVVCEPRAPTLDPYNYFLQQVTALKETAVESAAQSLSSAESVKANKDQIAEMLEDTISAKESALNSSESASQAATQSANLLKEFLEHEDYLKELDSAIQSSTVTAVDAAARAETAVLVGVENHNYEGNSLAHPNIMQIANEAKTIALGKASSLCFETKEDLLEWLRGEMLREDGKRPIDLKVGDNLYIVALDVPDYWWDGTTIQPLGTEKPDFSDFYTKSQIDARLSNANFEVVSRGEYNNRYSAGQLDAGRIYFVHEEA